MRNGLLKVIERPWIAIGLAAGVAVIVWAIGTRQQTHQIRAEFGDAIDMVPGLNVRYHGIVVGKTTSVTLDNGRAVVGIGISNSPPWPLHRGAVAVIRWGTLVGEGTRYVELDQGPSSAPVIPENGVIGTRDTVTPVEFDQLFGTFDAATRRNMRGTIDHLGAQLVPRAAQLNSGLHYTGPAVDTAAGLMSDLDYDRAALSGLVGSGAQTTHELAAHQAQISDLVGVAATTFQTFAQRTQQVQSSISAMPSTFTDVRTTLARLQPSIARLRTLMHDLAPGAARLPAFAKVAQPALVQLERIVPLGLHTVSTAQTSAPPVTDLLTVGVPFMQQLGTGVLTPVNPMLTCVTPYAPEVAGFLSNWASWGKNYDSFSHYGEVHANEGASSLTSTPSLITTAQFAQATGEQYAMPRPPGLNAGQPQFMPQCGYGQSALNPADDPESAK
jgi:virulence factor Mce-like protein